MSGFESIRSRIDPEALAGLEEYLTLTGPGGLAAITDLQERRAKADEILGGMLAAQPPSDAVVSEDRSVPGPEGEAAVGVRIYRPAGSDVTAAPGVFYIHSGGMVMGSVDFDDIMVRELTEALGCVAVSVEYRLAPEHPYPAGVEDCYAALCWMAKHAEELGVDPARIALQGVSG